PRPAQHYTLSLHDALPIYKQQIIDDLRMGRKSRSEALRNIAESLEVRAKCFNEAFVVMQYFGYLRRDPDILYLNWIQTLNQTNRSEEHTSELQSLRHLVCR